MSGIVNGNADSSATNASTTDLQAKWEAQHKDLSHKLEGRLVEQQSKLEGHLAAHWNKLEAQLLNQQAKFDSQQSKLDAQLAAQDRKLEMKMGEQTTSLQAAMETFMTVEARAAEQASHQDAWASRIEDEQDGLEARLAALRGEVSRVGPMIAACESAVDERVVTLTNDVNNRMSSTASASQAFEQRLEGRLKSQESDVGRLISKIASLENKVKEFSRLEARLADQQKALEAQLLVAAKLEGKLGELDQLANHVKAVQSSLDAQLARNDTLEQTLKKQQAQLDANAREQQQLEVRMSSISKREEQATSTVGALQFVSCPYLLVTHKHSVSTSWSVARVQALLVKGLYSPELSRVSFSHTSSPSVLRPVTLARWSTSLAPPFYRTRRVAWFQSTTQERLVPSSPSITSAPSSPTHPRVLYCPTALFSPWPSKRHELQLMMHMRRRRRPSRSPRSSLPLAKPRSIQGRTLARRSNVCSLPTKLCRWRRRSACSPSRSGNALKTL